MQFTSSVESEYSYSQCTLRDCINIIKCLRDYGLEKYLTSLQLTQHSHIVTNTAYFSLTVKTKGKKGAALIKMFNEAI